MKTAGLLLTLALAATPGRSETIAIVGGTIWTGGPQGTIPNGTLVIREGKIVAVGAGLRAPDGARVIEAGGRFVMPGIIDEHSHAAIEGDVNECTDIVTAEVRVGDVIDHRDPGIYRQLAGGVTTIHALHGSCNAIGGQNAILKLRWGKGPDELLFEGAPRSIKFALGENPKRSNARGRERRYPATRMGVEAVLRQHFEAARAYAREWDDHEKRVAQAGRGPAPVPPRRDLRLETLRDVLAGKVQVHAHCYRADEILMLIRLADEFGFRIRTFEHVLEGYKVAAEIARHGAGASTFIDWWGFKLEAYDAVPYNPAVLQSRGVLVSLNSDSGELARRLYWDAAKAVKYGVAEDEALRMITINPARQLDIDRRVGSLEVGKDADVAIFSTHPFSPDARVEMTLVDGTVYFDRAADLARRAATPAPAAPPSEVRTAARTDAQAPASGAETVALVGGRIVPVSGPRPRARHRGDLGRTHRGAGRRRDAASRGARDRRRGADRLPRPDRRLEQHRPGRDRRRFGLGGHHRDRRREPAGPGLGGPQPPQRGHPGGARQRRHHGPRGPARRPGLRPERRGAPGRHHPRRNDRADARRPAGRLPQRRGRTRVGRRRARAQDPRDPPRGAPRRARRSNCGAWPACWPRPAPTPPRSRPRPRARPPRRPPTWCSRRWPRPRRDACR